MVDSEHVVGGTILGAMGGLVAGAVLGLSTIPPTNSTAETYQHDNQRQVFRTTIPLQRDAIYVESEPGKGKYTSLTEYLNTIEDKNNRTVEEATIKRLVDW